MLQFLCLLAEQVLPHGCLHEQQHLRQLRLSLGAALAYKIQINDARANILTQVVQSMAIFALVKFSKIHSKYSPSLQFRHCENSTLGVLYNFTEQQRNNALRDFRFALGQWPVQYIAAWTH